MNLSFAIAPLFAACLAFPITSNAQIVSFQGYNSSTLGHVDDGSSPPISLGFSANLWGHSYNQLWVNNNGNITFDGAFDDPFTSFVPTSLASSGRVIVAPFFADVDTTAPQSGVVTYGTGTLGGKNAFAANYINVEPFFELPPKNSFQVVLIDRSDTGLGNFDIEFNYDSIAWEGGEATGSNELGLGGTAARVGLSDGAALHTYELPGSGINGALLDTNTSTGLRYSHPGVDFEIRGGNVVLSTPVPEPSTFALGGTLSLLAGVVFRRRRSPAAF